MFLLPGYASMMRRKVTPDGLKIFLVEHRIYLSAELTCSLTATLESSGPSSVTALQVLDLSTMPDSLWTLELANRINCSYPLVSRPRKRLPRIRLISLSVVLGTVGSLTSLMVSHQQLFLRGWLYPSTINKLLQ
jgi:hypothetical protein